MQISNSGYSLGGSLILFTLGIKVAFTPLIIAAQKNSMKSMLLAPEYLRFNQERMVAAHKGDLIRMHEITHEKDKIEAKCGIQGWLKIAPFMQGPVAFFSFFTIKDMANHGDVFAGLKTDGFLWFTDLTVADPYFLLPLMMSCSIFISLHKNPMIPQESRFVKYFAFLSMPVTSTFPAAVVLYWTISNFYQTVLVLMMYSDRGKKMLKVPDYFPGTFYEKQSISMQSSVKFKTENTSLK